MRICRPALLAGIAVCGFWLGAALFFCKGAALPGKAAYATAWLAAWLFGLHGKTDFAIACALSLSAAGDAVGSCHLFLPQLLLFAGAHIAYIAHFLPQAACSRRRIAEAAAAGIATTLLLFGRIVPRTGDPVERICVALYGSIITVMLLGVILYGGERRRCYLCAALLFVVSDATLAWNRFVAPVSGAEYRIMICYYAAQCLFALPSLTGCNRRRDMDSPHRPTRFAGTAADEMQDAAQSNGNASAG